MHTRNIVVATFVAAASLAVAEPERPKFYFPRQVKRQITNTTITSAAVQSTAGSRASSQPGTTDRDPFSLSNFFSSILGELGTPTTSTASATDSVPTETGVIVTVSTTEYVPTATSTDTNSTSTTEDTSTTTDSETSVTSESGLLPTITLPILSLPTLSLPDLTTSTSTATDATITDPATTSSAILIGPGGVVTPSSSSTDGGLVPVLSSALSDLTSVLGVTTNITDTTATSTATDSGILPTLSNILTSLLPTPTYSTDITVSNILTTPTVTSSDAGTTPTSVTNGTDTTQTLPPTETVSVPVTISTSTSSYISTNTTSIPGPTSTGSGTETGGSNGTVSTSTSISVGLPPTSTYTVPQNTTTPSTAGATTLSTTITSAPVSYTSVPVTGTITNSESWLPTTIIIQPSSSALSTGEAPTTTTGLPTYFPQAITPQETPAAQPDDTTPIQISFGFGLNYKWIVETPLAAAQLFSLLPQAVAHDLGFSTSDILMHSIVPYDTSAQLGFFTSQAILYIPSQSVEQLRLDHKIPSSALYTNKDLLILNMTNQINPAIDIIMGSTLDGSGTGTADGSYPTSTSTDPNDALGAGGSSSEQTSAQKGTTAAIAVGSLGLAGAYGAAMFIIARRYKRKKQRHQRTSSITNPSEMRQTGSPAMMGGALLSRDFVAGSYGGVSPNTRDSQGSGRSGMNNSGRTAFISAPVAAENSLGWN